MLSLQPIEARIAAKGNIGPHDVLCVGANFLCVPRIWRLGPTGILFVSHEPEYSSHKHVLSYHKVDSALSRLKRKVFLSTIPQNYQLGCKYNIPLGISANTGFEDDTPTHYVSKPLFVHFPSTTPLPVTGTRRS